METEERVEKYGTKAVRTILSSMILEDFQQEFEITFIDSASSYITLDLIHANTPGMREGDREKEIEDGIHDSIEIHVWHTADDLLANYSALGLDAVTRYGKLYMGYDVARRRDAAVIFVIGVLPNGKKRSLAEIEMRNQTFEYQVDQFRKIMRSLPVVRACIDQSGMGEPVCETLQKDFGEAKIEGVHFTVESKETLAIGVRTGLEQKEFALQNDSKFHRQIHSIKRIPTTGGHFRYDAERNDQGHADSFWAWALANNAVVGAKTVTPDFYTKRKAQREGIKNVTATVGTTLEKPSQARKRGKSYATLMREANRANRKGKVGGNNG
jgi:phage FluMu gp28-like protein